ncbi:MAG: glycoside hydrolase family 20 zincin-like fold domain-containing protein [Victivallaceae bacterium]|nr:glycoside hydrolase family 20 zincin-like fold domain-containing protein [Victivallaceae bacterium]
MKFILFSALLFAVFAAPGTTAPSAEPRVVMTGNSGLAVRSLICEISLGSRIVAVEPPWKTRYFVSTEPGVTPINENGRKAQLTDGNGGAFALLEYSASAMPDDRVYIDLSCRMNSDAQAVLEYSAMCIPGDLLAGARFQGTAANGRRFSGTVSGFPPEGNNIASVTGAFKEITFFTKLGELTIEVTRGPGLSINDRRSNEFMGNKCFWLGIGGAGLSAKTNFESSLCVTFKISRNIKFAKETKSQLPQEPPEEDAAAMMALTAPALPLLPIPRSINFNDGMLAPSTLQLEIDPKLRDGETDDRLERAAVRLLPDNDAGKITMSATAAFQPQSYALSVDASGVTISAGDGAGAFYALQMLKQLRTPRGIPFVHVMDEPDVRFRGVHLCLDSTDNTYFELVEKVLSPMRINAVVGEVEYVKWDATAQLGIQQPGGMTKAELAKFVELCRDNYIDFIPLFQTLGHSEWLFKNGRNLDMSEDPEHPYAYNVSHPGVYPLMTALLDEIFTVCRPKYLHIGHDEVTMTGRFPHRPENVAKGMRKIVYDDVMFYHKYAADHNARVMMWHDMFMTGEESRTAFGGPPENLAELRRSFPRDIIFCVWRYDNATPDHPEVATLMNEGFDVIGCPWYARENPENWARAITGNGAMGTLATTWAGYFGSKTLLTQNFYQVVPYLIGGAWGWRCDDANYNYDFARILSWLISAPASPVPEKSGALIDITPAANLTLDAKNNPFLLYPNAGIDQFPQKNYYGSVKFKLPRIDGKMAAVAFRSRLNPFFTDETRVIPINRKAAKIHLLNTVIGAAPPKSTAMGKAVVSYKDGTQFQYDLQYGRDVGNTGEEFNYGLTATNAAIWMFANREQRIWFATIDNPYPDREISGIALSGSPEQFPYYVLGITVTD